MENSVVLTCEKIAYLHVSWKNKAKIFRKTLRDAHSQFDSPADALIENGCGRIAMEVPAFIGCRYGMFLNRIFH